MKDGKIGLLLADDQQLFAQSLRYVITGTAPDMDVLGVAPDGAQAVAMAEALRPDIVLMDVRMPEMDGVDAAKLICSRLADTKIIMLSTFLDEEYLRASLERGAKGYLLKSVSPEELLEAIRAVHRGLDPVLRKGGEPVDRPSLEGFRGRPRGRPRGTEQERARGRVPHGAVLREPGDSLAPRLVRADGAELHQLHLFQARCQGQAPVPQADGQDAFALRTARTIVTKKRALSPYTRNWPAAKEGAIMGS